MSITKTESEYLFLLRGTDWDRSLSPAELEQHMQRFLEWFSRLSGDGVLKMGQPLSDEGRTVSGKNGIVADGPFAETKEAVGGYFIVNAGSLDEAMEIARRCPMLSVGIKIEVRPIVESCQMLDRMQMTPRTTAAATTADA